MSGDYAHSSEKPVKPALRAVDVRLGFFALAALLLAAIAWGSATAFAQLPLHGPAWESFLGNSLVLMGLHLTVCMAIERSLASTRLGRAQRYRLAFLGSWGVNLAHAAYFLLASADFQRLGLLGGQAISAGAGAFLGGLLATGLNEGFWENNSPPAEALQEKVHVEHLARCGPPLPYRLAKRGLDLLLALAGLVLSAPVWLAAIFLIWLEDPGPVLFVKNSVGRGGWNFRQFKLRTMVHEAERHTGPVLSMVGDARVLRTGRFLRKTALDELPQLINILMGEMSFVGPRPQRTVLVDTYLREIPGYAERHRMPPGLAGLAQVAGDYYLTPRQKLRFDRLYIQHAGAGFDLKLIFLAFLLTFWYRWQPGWNGRLPRHWLHPAKTGGRVAGSKLPIERSQPPGH